MPAGGCRIFLLSPFLKPFLLSAFEGVQSTTTPSKETLTSCLPAKGQSEAKHALHFHYTTLLLRLQPRGHDFMERVITKCNNEASFPYELAALQ